MHQEESTAELLAKLVDLKKTNPERYDEIMAIIDSYDETGEGAHMSASQLMSHMPEELAENIKLIVRETYEAACMECGYEEGLEEETEAVEEYLAEAKKNWIKNAIKKPGALHKKAEEKGVIILTEEEFKLLL